LMLKISIACYSVFYRWRRLRLALRIAHVPGPVLPLPGLGQNRKRTPN
jgi:hypothetical protein